MLITISAKESDYEKAKARISQTFTKKAENLQKQVSKKKLQLDIQLKKHLAKNKTNWKQANKNLKAKYKKQMP